MVPSLLDIANELDSLGLHREADALDRILRKRADVLAYREKPFLAQLAKIMMVLKNYKSGEVIRENLVFPLSGTKLIGMSRQTAIEKVQKHLKSFTEQFLVPNLDQRYKGTKYEASYRQFIGEVYELAQMLEGIFSTRSEQQSIRDGMNAIEQVKRMIGRLMVYVRSRQQLSEKPIDTSRPQEIQKSTEESKLEREVEDILQNSLQILGNLEIAVKQLDEDAAHEAIQQLLAIFPRRIDSSSPVFRLVVDAFRKKDVIPFVRQDVIDEEARGRLDIAQEVELIEGEAQYKKYSTELVKKNDLLRHVEENEERARRLQTEAAKYEFPTVMIPYFKEFQLKTKSEPNTYLMPEIVSHYKNKFRRNDVIAGDLSNLEKWLNQYKNRPEINQVISFSNFLSKLVEPKAAALAFGIINGNIADLKSEAENDIRATEDARDAVEGDLLPLRMEWRETQNQVIWDLWYEQYIVRMVQTLNYILAPETRGEETSAQAFNKALAGFNKVLNYNI